MASHPLPVKLVPKLPTRNPVYRFFWTFDSLVSSSLFEAWDAVKRGGVGLFLLPATASASAGSSGSVVDLVDDGATFGTVVAFGLLAYALPPFSGTGDVWNKGREFAVTFTDANGEIIGRRGIRQDDAIPLGGNSAACDQGGSGHRGCPLLRPFRRRHDRHDARHHPERARQRRSAGRLVAHPAGRQEPVPVAGANHPAQGP